MIYEPISLTISLLVRMGRGIMPLLFHASSAIGAANLAVDNFFQLSGDKLPANVGNMVDKHLPFEVVIFVL